jgi:hypothetical protein
VIAVAEKKYGELVFRRRHLMEAVEAHIHQIGAWTLADDFNSSSRGLKSEGLAKIDWAISHLKQAGKLEHIGRDQWRLPQTQVARK